MCVEFNHFFAEFVNPDNGNCQKPLTGVALFLRAIFFFRSAATLLDDMLSAPFT